MLCRLEDVRAAEIDKVQIASCFRPGDVVKAEVVSLGTSRDYYLSTAQNHLGVVYAKSVAGEAHLICFNSEVSWQANWLSVHYTRGWAAMLELTSCITCSSSRSGAYSNSKLIPEA